MKIETLVPLMLLFCIIFFALFFYFGIKAIINMVTKDINTHYYKKGNNIKSHCIDCTKYNTVNQKDSK